MFSVFRRGRGLVHPCTLPGSRRGPHFDDRAGKIAGPVQLVGEGMLPAPGSGVHLAGEQEGDHHTLAECGLPVLPSDIFLAHKSM